MRRTYNTSAVLAPLPARKAPLPSVDTNTRQRLLTGLGEAANCHWGHVDASRLLTKVLGPGWEGTPNAEHRSGLSPHLQPYPKIPSI